MAILNPKDDYTFFINGQPVKVGTELNLNADGEVRTDGMRFSQKLEGSITCELNIDDVIKKDFKHKMSEYQRKIGKPKTVFVPESYVWEK